ncbi:heavy-metal-associated domain-containing protein [Inquilinus sp. CA228]|uniref:heavy-metal-associated domain-containing protein n=1 Tax=Inquilinus sp. CA228 TaxID=3455609 RepID=UPI003F8D1DC2
MGVPLSFRVEDMTCGHCAGTIKGAIEGSIPGAKVEADPVRKLVSVTGAADRAQVAALIAEAGYTPEAA